nr:unnamed protein product [Spirometra erinaceieuropaei]
MVQLGDTVQSTVLAVLVHARRQHQDWFDDSDAAAISNMLTEKNRLHITEHAKERGPLRRRLRQLRPSPQHGEHGVQASTATRRCLRRVDIVDPLPYTTSGHRYMLVLVDYFTTWAEAIPLHRQDAALVTNALLKEWVCRCGAPFSLHSDCGANFESHLLREVYDLLLIHKTRTTPTHPEGNGQVELTNRTIINILKAFADDHHPRDWDVQLPFAMMAYRAAVHSSTDHAPFYMLIGRQFRLPADANVPTQQPMAYTTDNYVMELQELLRLTYNLART